MTFSAVTVTLVKPLDAESTLSRRLHLHQCGKKGRHDSDHKPESVIIYQEWSAAWNARLSDQHVLV